MALLYARRTTKPLASPLVRSAQLNPEIAGQHLALLVSMKETPGGEDVDLSNADGEIKAVEGQLRHSNLRFKPVALTDKRHNACLAALRCSSVVHIAGQGRVNKQVPSHSALLLEYSRTRPLKMEAVPDGNGAAESSDTPLFLAYLSACSTGAVANPDLVGETIHMVAGMQLAGFRHVVGTLWEVLDWCCVQMAVKFYKFLTKGNTGDYDVCRALHKVTREIRDKQFELDVFQTTPQEVRLSRLDFGSHPLETVVHPQWLSQGNVSNFE